MGKELAKKLAKRGKEMDRLRKKVTSSQKSAREFLISTGVYTKEGKLSPNYR